MKSLNEEQRRKVIITFYEQKKELGIRHRVKHFESMNVRPSTTYRMLQRLENGCTAEREKGSGGHNKVLNGNQKRALRAVAINRVGVSTRKLASRFRLSKSTISRTLTRMGATCRARTKAPLYTSEQQSRAQQRVKKLATDLRNKILIMDDESYFSMKSDRLSINSSFYTLDYESAPPEVKFARQKKFPSRSMVWLAISIRGISEPLFLPSGGAMSGEIYRKECIKACLLPFIKKHHQHDAILFWPDGASAHYAKATTELLQAENISFVAKTANPPNLPQARPIENVWSLLKSEVYRDGWEAKSVRSLKIRIKKAIGKLDLASIQRDLEQVPTKLAKIGRSGVYSVL